ncbi:MAG: hypothetical protein ABNH26_08830 [Celeribacter sp.]|jgi:hypothetical protein
MTAALIAYALAQLADILTTLRGLRRGAVGQLDRWAMESVGGSGWVVFKMVLTGCAAWAFWASGAEWGLWLVAAVTGAVAVRNVWVT